MSVSHRRQAARETDPDRPACDRCFAWLDLYELGERFCGLCREALRCQQDAHEAGERLGLYVRWTVVRGRGLQAAIEEARLRKQGIDPETLAAERARWAAGE